MNRIVPELAKTIASVLRVAFPQLPEAPKVSAASTDPNRQVSGVLAFLGNLLANSRSSDFLGESDAPEDAVLRGSVAGLASGIEAVADQGEGGKTALEQRPLNAAVIVLAYVAGAIVAFIFRRKQCFRQMEPGAAS